MDQKGIYSLLESKITIEPDIEKKDVQQSKRPIWQPRFWEHVIRDENDFERHLEYIHYNPVKHGLVNRPIDWEWSSFHRYVKQGTYHSDWASVDQKLMEEKLSKVAVSAGE